MLRRQKAPLGPWLAGSEIVSGRGGAGSRRPDDVKRQHVNGQRSRHGSATFKGTATPPLMSRKVMFVLLGECVCGCLAACGGEHPVRVIPTVRARARARVTDSGQILSVRGAASQLIRSGRCSYQVLQRRLLTPPSAFPKWLAGRLDADTGERADVGGGAVWAVIVPFHT